MAITYFEISYPNFVLGAIIDPVEANQNNYEIVTKINALVDGVNANESEITLKSSVVYVDTKLSDLAGVGRTTQTIVGNATNLTTHKTSTDHDGRYYTEAELNAGQLDNRYFTETELLNGSVDSRYYTKAQLNANQLGNIYYTRAELTPWLRGGDTIIREDVFTIVNSDNGDGTFTYSYDGVNIVGMLGDGGEQIFSLVTGVYTMGANTVEVIINDTLRRSVASGGIEEISTTEVALTSPEGSGAEVTIRYYERIGLSANYNIVLSETKPPSNNGTTMWFQIV